MPETVDDICAIIQLWISCIGLSNEIQMIKMIFSSVSEIMNGNILSIFKET